MLFASARLVAFSWSALLSAEAVEPLLAILCVAAEAPGTAAKAKAASNDSYKLRARKFLCTRKSVAGEC